MIRGTKKANCGFSLVELIVATLILSIVTVPMLTMLYFGTVTVEKQSATTIQSIISRETLQLIVDDLEKYASLNTRIETVGDNITKLVILNDDRLETSPKKVMYIYDNDSKILLRVIDSMQVVVLSEEQLGDRYYKEADLSKFIGVEPITFTKDNVLNTVSVYLRVKVDQEAKPQENKYIYNLREENRKVIHGTEDGVIWVNEEETFNFRDCSFTLETYLKITDTEKDKCIFNLVDSDNNSKVNLHINGKKIKLKLNDSKEVIDSDINVTPNKWQKVVVIYDDVKKEIKVYLTKDVESGYNPVKDIENLKLELKATINYDAGSLFTNGKETVPITKIYIANTGENDRNGFIGYLYEPRIWKGVVDIYKDVENSTDKYDYTKKLTGLEQGLVVYIKDDYRIKSKKVGTEYEV